MNTSDFQSEKLRQLSRQLFIKLQWHEKICSRLQRLRVPIDDPLGKALMAARDAVAHAYRESLKLK